MTPIRQSQLTTFSNYEKNKIKILSLTLIIQDMDFYVTTNKVSNA